MKRLHLKLATFAAVAPSVLALPGAALADEVMNYLMGDYRVTETGKGSGTCRFSLIVEPDAGGQVIPDKECARSLPEMTDSARWSPDDGSGFLLFDALRKPIGHAVESEAGYVLTLADERHFSVEALDGPRLLSPDERTIGKWMLYLKSGEPGQHVCKVEFRADHTIAAPACGARWPLDKATWSATENALRITPQAGKRITLEWLESVTLGAAGGDWGMAKE